MDGGRAQSSLSTTTSSAWLQLFYTLLPLHDCEKSHLRLVAVPRKLLSVVFNRQLGLRRVGLLMKPVEATVESTIGLNICQSDGDESRGVTAVFDQ